MGCPGCHNQFLWSFLQPLQVGIWCRRWTAVHPTSTPEFTSKGFLHWRLHFGVPQASCHQRMEWGRAAECLSYGAESPYSCPGEDLRRQHGTGKLHAACLPHFAMPCCLLRGRSCTPASLTRLRASSTRTHANVLRSSLTHGAAGLCLYCASPDHFIRICPVRRPAVNTLQLDPDVSTLSWLPVQLLTPESSVSVSALVDSGSSGNLISQALLTRLCHRPAAWS